MSSLPPAAWCLFPALRVVGSLQLAAAIGVNVRPLSVRFTASNDKPNMFRGFYALLLASSRTHTPHTHTRWHMHSKSISIHVHFPLSTFNFQLFTAAAAAAASGNHSVNVNVNLRLVACPMHPQAEYLSMLFVLVSPSPTLSLFSFRPSICVL